MEGVHKLRVPLVVDTKVGPELARHEMIHSSLEVPCALCVYCVFLILIEATR